jgi:predicted aspartyl protease
MIATLLLAWMMGVASRAEEFYRVKDPNGSIIYTDNAGNIPKSATVQPLKPSNTQAGQAVNTQNKDRFFTPFTLGQSGHLLVDVELVHGTRSVKAKLVYDTGAPYVHIHRRVANALQLNPVRIFQNQLSDGSNKKTTPEAVARVTLKLGPAKIEQTPVIWHLSDTYLGPPWDWDGMLGMNIIRQYDTRIDYEKKQIEWIRLKKTP